MSSEEKGFRELHCHQCEKRLKFAVAPQQYGKSIQVKCPGCYALNRVFISVPVVQPRQVTSSAWPSLGGSGKYLNNLLNLLGKFDKK